MKVIKVRNVHQALPEALYQLRADHVARESRNGRVLMAPEPVTTFYTHPWEKVMFWPERDANPFFHLFEALWILSGRRDVKYLHRFNSNISRYSDDGETFHGAYGHRWRRHFEDFWRQDRSSGTSFAPCIDQLQEVVDGLKENPDARRMVLAMWDPESDLVNQTSKDLPCNTHAYVSINHEGKLDLTVCCRSNDIVWGCYGANAVHFAMLQEYLAAKIGISVGRYWQISNNWHLYTEVHGELLANLSQAATQPPSIPRCPYSQGTVQSYPLIRDPQQFDAELPLLLDCGLSALGYREPFIRRVALPMLAAWECFRGDSSPEGTFEAMKTLSAFVHIDWCLAGLQWMERRHITRLRKEQSRAEPEPS